MGGAVRCLFAVIVTIPAFFPNSNGRPVAFLAVTSISVIGLYIAYVIPIFLRWRTRQVRAGPWNNGAKYRWMNTIGFVWVGICVVIFCLPFTPAGCSSEQGFSWTSVNYAPLVTIFVIVP